MGKETKKPVDSIKHTNTQNERSKEKEGEKGISRIFEEKRKKKKNEVNVDRLTERPDAMFSCITPLKNFLWDVSSKACNS